MARAEKNFQPDHYFLRATAVTVKNLRIEQKMTQEQLANKAQIHWRYVQEIESGTKDKPKQVKNISIGMFYSLCKALNHPPDYIMTQIINQMDSSNKK